MLTPEFLRGKFDAGLKYDAYVATGAPHQREDWKAFRARALEHAGLDSQQRSALADFTRRVNIVVLSGVWCGDCVAQCPLLAMIAEQQPAGLIDVRFLDRDEHSDLHEHVKICGGYRVPTAIFMSETFDFVSLYGDRSLSRLRRMAARSLGASCPLPSAEVAGDEIRATLADWLAEIERVHLILRLSPKLRDMHGD